MQITTKFDIGDVVYVIERVQDDVKVPCQTCDGDGSVWIKGHLFTCPRCSGTGESFRSNDFSFTPHGPFEVESMDFYLKSDNIWLVDYKVGPEWCSEDRLAASFDEAAALCSKLNEKEDRQEG